MESTEGYIASVTERGPRSVPLASYYSLDNTGAQVSVVPRDSRAVLVCSISNCPLPVIPDSLPAQDQGIGADQQPSGFPLPSRNEGIPVRASHQTSPAMTRKSNDATPLSVYKPPTALTSIPARTMRFRAALIPYSLLPLGVLSGITCSSAPRDPADGPPLRTTRRTRPKPKSNLVAQKPCKNPRCCAHLRHQPSLFPHPLGTQCGELGALHPSEHPRLRSFSPKCSSKPGKTPFARDIQT